MQKPKNDTSDYETFVLDNKLRVFLVTDKDAKESAVFMRVGVGYYQDPKDIPGLAHLTEHMLFNGTQKYPDENYFSQYVKENSGYSNAHTTCTKTCYYYTISPIKLNESLEIFCDFFENPLLNKDSIEREINAVNSEYEKTIFDDSRIENRLFQVICDENNWKTKFGAGNTETLNVPNIADKVKDFYEKYYSSHLMTLIIIIKNNAENIKNTIVNNYSKIKNKNVNTKELINDVPYFTTSKQIYFVPNKDKQCVYINWNLPHYKNDFKSSPLNFLSHLLGYEGNNSLHSYLYEKGHIESLSSSYHGDFNFCTFSIIIELTRGGDKNFVINCTFEYIKMLLENVNSELMENLHKDEILLNKFDSDNSIKSSPLQKCEYISAVYGSYNSNIDISEILILKSLCHNYDKIKENLRFCLSSMCNEHHIIAFGSKEYENICDNTIIYYNSKYKILDEKYTYDRQDVNFSMPNKNKYISVGEIIFNSNNCHNYDNYEHPKQININNNINILPTNKYKSPSANLYLEIKLANINQLESIFVNLYLQIIKFCANKELYDLECARYDINISYSGHNLGKKILVQINGNYEKFDFVCEKIFDIIKNYKLDEEIFNIEKEKTIKNIKNKIFDSPYKKINECFVNYSNDNNNIITDEKALEIIDKINFNDVLLIKNKMFSGGETKCLISGNINDNIINNISTCISNIMPVKIQDDFKIKIPQMKDEEYIHKIKNDKELINCTALCLHCGEYNETENSILLGKNYVILRIIHSIISSVFFDTLRTKECYGYIVSSSVSNFTNNTINNLYYNFVVQSSVKDNNNIKERISKFIIDYYDEIINLKEETIRNICETNINIFLAPFQNLIHESYYHFDCIRGSDYIDKKKILIELYKNIKKEEIIDFYKDKFLNRNSFVIKIEK